MDRTRELLSRWWHALCSSPTFRRAALVLSLLAVTLAGVAIGLRVDGRVHGDVGPFTATFALNPSLSGGTDVEVPPLGSLSVASHDGPAHLNMRLESLDQKNAEQLFKEPNAIEAASASAVPDVERNIVRLVLQSAGAAMLASMLLAAFVFRRMRRVAICGGLALLTVVVSGVIAVSTFRPSSIEEPKFQGLLANAPSLIGDAHSIATRFGAYRDELQGLVTNVSKLYETVSTLPVYEPTPGTLRVLHVSDIHLNPAAWSVISTVVTQFHIDLVIDTGDINDWGSTLESSFVNSIGALTVPYVYIRGNHDSATTARAVARQKNAIVLENKVVTVKGLTIAGIGDPRFTPDKDTRANDSQSGHQATDFVYASGEKLAATIRDSKAPVDIAMVHDPASAGALDGLAQLVLAGHLHHREVSTMPAVPGAESTKLMVEGSTGGAGLRGLEGEQPTPLEMSVLYMDPNHHLEAYDEITLGGTGQSQVTLQRHKVEPPTESSAEQQGP
jgi:predicted phosphodiesterase